MTTLPIHRTPHLDSSRPDQTTELEPEASIQAAKESPKLLPFHPVQDMHSDNSVAPTSDASGRQNGPLLSTLSHEEHEEQQRSFAAARDGLLQALQETATILMDLLEYDGDIAYPSLPEASPNPLDTARFKLKRSQTQPRPELEEPDHSKHRSPLGRTQSFVEDAGGSRPLSAMSAMSAESFDSENARLTARQLTASNQPVAISGQTSSLLDVLGLESPLNHPLFSSDLRSLNSVAIATLFNSRIKATLSHLQALRARVVDPTSKVLVTGDLNAGKSTFINALLRRDVLPTDQQPLTEVFCEVMSARSNAHVEEVHAIRNSVNEHEKPAYDREDQNSFDRFDICNLPSLVDNQEFAHLKIYVEPEPGSEDSIGSQSIIQSPLVSISLIDAPGLNKDSLTSTALFARQEEIDIVVFVCNAENHFTLSGKEFLWSAGREKAFLFIVVNRFDLIGQTVQARQNSLLSRNGNLGGRQKNPFTASAAIGSRDMVTASSVIDNARGRCRRRVLDQIKSISESTWLEAGDLVHFVDSKSMLEHVLSLSERGGDALSDQVDERDKHGDERTSRDEDIEAFVRLEDCLRTFTLLKRAKSKLNPAKTYLQKLIRDLKKITDFNCVILQHTLRGLEAELSGLIPQIEQAEKARGDLASQIDSIADECSRKVTLSARDLIGSCLDGLNSDQLQALYRMHWRGWSSLWDYPARIKDFLTHQVGKAVSRARNDSRAHCADVVESIKNMKATFISETNVAAFNARYVDRPLNMENMYRRNPQRQIKIEFGVTDFLDADAIWRCPSTLWCKFADFMSIHRQPGKREVGFVSLSFATLSLYGSSLIRPGDLGYITYRLMNIARSLGFDSRFWRRATLPCVSALGLGLGLFVVVDLPYAIPRNLTRKARSQLHNTGNDISAYPQGFLEYQVDEIAQESRKVVQIAAFDVKKGMSNAIEEIRNRKKGMGESKRLIRESLVYFGSLRERVNALSDHVFNLEVDGWKASV